MNVPINMPVLGREEMREVGRVLRGGALTDASLKGGPNVREFEDAARRFLGSSYAVAVNSGTAAIQAALHALGIGKGDEVLVPSFTFVATANAVVATGARPVFVDIDKRHTMDPEDLEKKTSQRSKAVIPVHLYGNVARIEEICRIADERGLRVIEDAAQSMGSTYRKKQSGTFGDVGCFSLYPAKVITAGEGGLVVTGNKDLYDKLRMVRNHGMVRGYDSETFGLNLRMPEINAAIAKVQVGRLPSFLERRRANARTLSGLLEGADVTLPEQRAHEEVNWYLYTISTERQAKLKKSAQRGGVWGKRVLSDTGSPDTVLCGHERPLRKAAGHGAGRRARAVAAGPSWRATKPFEEDGRDCGQDRVMLILRRLTLQAPRRHPFFHSSCG